MAAYAEKNWGEKGNRDHQDEAIRRKKKKAHRPRCAELDEKGKPEVHLKNKASNNKKESIGKERTTNEHTPRSDRSRKLYFHKK